MLKCFSESYRRKSLKILENQTSFCFPLNAYNSDEILTSDPKEAVPMNQTVQYIRILNVLESKFIAIQIMIVCDDLCATQTNFDVFKLCLGMTIN